MHDYILIFEEENHTIRLISPLIISILVPHLPSGCHGYQLGVHPS